MPGPIFRWLLPIALSILAASAAPAAEGGPSLQAPLAATGGGRTGSQRPGQSMRALSSMPEWPLLARRTRPV